MNQILVDCHLHTNNSPDSEAEPLDMCLCAKKKGLKLITITDHCEMNMYYERYNKIVKNSVRDALSLDGKVEGLKVLHGVEMGQALQNLKGADEMLDTMEFDFVLASLHNPPADCDYPLCKETEENPNYLEAFLAKDYAYLKYTKETAPIIFKDYFEDMYKTVLWGRFDSLAHMTYPLRYCKGEQNIDIDLIKEFKPIITDIFKEIIKRDIALELNSGGLRNPIHEISPNYDLVKLYKECGGRLVTLGADAHTPTHVASGITDSIEMLKSLGFTEYHYYEKRKPVAVPIV